MNVLIVGCGYLGTALGERLLNRGHEVWALRRDEAALKSLAAKGFRTFQADLLNLELLKKLPSFNAVIFCQAPGKNENYEKVYYQGTRNILDALWKQELKKIVLISSTSVYSTQDGSWVDELNDPRSGGKMEEDSEWLLKTEDLVLSERQGIVLRLGGIYGPERNRIKTLRATQGRPGGSPLQNFSGAFVNRIHVEDAVSGIELLLQKGKTGGIYLGVDDQPSTQKEFYEWIHEKLSLPRNSDETPKDAARGSNKRCSNKKIKALGLKLRYPTFKEGYTEWI